MWQSQAWNLDHWIGVKHSFRYRSCPLIYPHVSHYHEKEGNSMSLCSSQWVGSSSLVIANSTVSLLSSISKSCSNVLFRIHVYVFAEDSRMLGWFETRRIGGLSLPWKAVTPLLLCASAHACCTFGPCLHKKTFCSSPFKECSDSEKTPHPQTARAGTYPFCLFLSTFSCPFILGNTINVE